jgi:NAD(P)-dependent dehydrogenase (short-subunit alcohol dehydrogenase family)
MNNLFDIQGNVTVITGGTGVLGRAIAKYLALNGARVVILGRKEDVGNQIAADIRAAGGGDFSFEISAMRNRWMGLPALASAATVSTAFRYDASLAALRVFNTLIMASLLFDAVKIDGTHARATESSRDFII